MPSSQNTDVTMSQPNLSSYDEIEKRIWAEAAANAGGDFDEYMREIARLKHEYNFPRR